MINIIANQEFKRKMGWFLILMFWVGMVTAVVINESEIEKEHLSKMSAAEGQVEISDEEEINNTQVEATTSNAKRFNLSKDDQKTNNKQKNFFVEYRIERDQARSEQINLLREMINNPNSDKELKTKAQSQ